MYFKSSNHFGENECIRLHLSLLFSWAGGGGGGGEEPANICTYVWHSSIVTITTKWQNNQVNSKYIASSSSFVVVSHIFNLRA